MFLFVIIYFWNTYIINIDEHAYIIMYVTCYVHHYMDVIM